MIVESRSDTRWRRAKVYEHINFTVLAGKGSGAIYQSSYIQT